MHAFPFNSSSLLLSAALFIGATVGLRAQTPPLEPNTALRVDFSGAITNPDTEYTGMQVTGSIYIYQPNFNAALQSYERLPEYTTAWISDSDVPTGRISATLSYGGNTALFYTNVSGVSLSNNTYDAPPIGRVYADQFDIGAGNWNNNNPSSVVNYNGIDYTLPGASVNIYGFISEFSGTSVFDDPTTLTSITGLSSLTSSDFANPLNGFEGRFNYFGPGYDDFIFSLSSISVSMVAIPEPQTYALALGAASLAVVGAVKWRRRQSGRA